MNPSPRKIKLFEEALSQLNNNYDIFRIKNDFDEVHAYESGRKFFLEHPEYTHLAVLPDDLLVYPADVEQLVKDVEEFPDYDIISGICNFAYSNKRFFNHMSVTEMKKYEGADRIRRTGKFKWPDDIMTRERFDEILKNPKEDKLVRCAHIAFSFPLIRRNIVEKIPFSANAMGVDTAYSQACLKENVKMYADVRVEMLHMKGMEFNREMSQVIEFAFANGIDTLVHKGSIRKPMIREEIFMPKKVEQVEA